MQLFQVAIGSGKSRTRDMQSEAEAVSFNDWKEALAKSDFPVAVQAKMQRAIFGFLGFCKGKCAPASIRLAKAYIAQRELQAGRRDEELRAGLRWFVTKGRVRKVERTREPTGGNTVSPFSKMEGTGRNLMPKLAQEDRGIEFWEQKLITACRERGFLWRTEETYRFATFLQPRPPCAVTGDWKAC